MFRSSWKIASFRGIAVKVHISLVILMAYLVFVVAVRFPFAAQEAEIPLQELSFGPMTWGVIVALSLFASVVAHEFGHALTAQAMGVKVRDITLMMLGGVSAMEKMPEKPFQEFKLAVMGPIVSFAIAAVMLGIYSFAQNANLAFFAYWLGSANLILGIFNLLPAFPLDGGRALRSILASRQGVVRATQNSVTISKIFAWAFGLFGLLTFNVILMLIAFFVYASAQSELFFMVTRGALKGMTVGDVAIRISPIGEDDSVSAAAHRMLQSKSAVIPVETGSAAPNVITLNDVRRIRRESWQSTPVKQVMQLAPKTLQTEEQIGESLQELASAPMGALPVRDGNHIAGVVRYSDIAELLQLRALEREPVELVDEDRDRAA